MASGQRTAKSGGRPGASDGDVDTESQTCLRRVRGPVAQPPVRAGLEASLNNPSSQGDGRPCYEADNSVCRGEWRREAGSRQRRLMSATGKRAWRTPTPIVWPLPGWPPGRGVLVYLAALPDIGFQAAHWQGLVETGPLEIVRIRVESQIQEERLPAALLDAAHRLGRTVRSVAWTPFSSPSIRFRLRWQVDSNAPGR